MSSAVIATDCRIDETALLLFKYLYLEPKEGWYTFKVSGQRERKETKGPRRNGREQERTDTFLRVVRKAGINSPLWHVSFTLWLFQQCQPLFLLAPEFPFKEIIMFVASPVQDPKTKRIGCAILTAFIQLFFGQMASTMDGLFDVCFVHLSLVWQFHRHAYSTQGQTEI